MAGLTRTGECLIRDFSYGLLPTTTVSLSGNSIADREIGKHNSGPLERASGRCRAMLLPQASCVEAFSGYRMHLASASTVYDSRKLKSTGPIRNWLGRYPQVQYIRPLPAFWLAEVSAHGVAKIERLESTLCLRSFSSWLRTGTRDSKTPRNVHCSHRHLHARQHRPRLYSRIHADADGCTRGLAT